MMRFGEFQLSIVRESTFKLDGGAMFGVVPKTLWAPVAQPDISNCIELACNLLVIQTRDKNILVETGMGPRWNSKERERFQLQTLVDHKNALAVIGLQNADIDIVICSHMHFDHLGGAVIFNNGELIPTFPNAKVFVQRGEFKLAHSINARGRGSYRADDYRPLLEHKKLILIDGDQEIVPGIWARVTGGHTSHHQIVTFESASEHGVYFADIVPTRNHLNPAWVMGYDHHPLASCDAKDRWLSIAAKENWLVVFDHETAVPWGHVSLNENGKYEWQPLQLDTLAM